MSDDTKGKLAEYIAERRLARLPEGAPREQVEAILDRPDVDAYVQAIEAPLLLDLIKRAGWDDAMELLGHVSSEQLQTFVDLDCWRRDTFLPQALEPWLVGLLTEAGDAAFKRHCREVDPEVLAMYFKANLLVDLMDEEGLVPPAFAAMEVETSPDGVYALVYPEDERTAAILRAMLDRLYEVDRVLAWTLLEAARWELMSPMEDEAYRWRTSRLEELGFVEFDEAMVIYQPLDPVRYREKLEAGDFEPKPRAAVPSSLPVVAVAASEERFYAAAMMQRLEGEALDRTMAEFVALQNRAFIAEGIEPGDVSEGQFVAERTTGYLSIGLEYLSRRDDARALEILRSAPLRNVFRVGFTIIDRLHENVSRLRRRPATTIIEGVRFSLLRGPDAALCEALLRARPMYSAAPTEQDIFHTQSQVDDAALRLGLIAFKQLWVFGVLGVAPGELVRLAYGDVWLNEPPTVTFDAIFATWVASYMLGRKPDMYGLSSAEVQRLPEVLRSRPWEGDLLGFFDALVGQLLESLPAGARLMTRWLEQTVDELADELGSVAGIDDVAMFTDVVIVQREGALA